MSITYNAYFSEPKTISRDEIVKECAALNWRVLMRDPTSPWSTPRYLEPTGTLAHEDYYYGADLRRMTQAEFEQVLAGDDLSPLWEISGGEAIICFDPDFSITDLYDPEDLPQVDPTFLEHVEKARFRVEVVGGSYFAVQLSQIIARLGGGFWDDPQS